MSFPVATGSVVVRAEEAEAFAVELREATGNRPVCVSPLFAPALTAPMCLSALEPLLEGGFAPVVHLAEDVRFHAPADVGERLECRATLRSCRPALRGATVTVDTLVASADGEPRAEVRTTVQVLARRAWPTFGSDTPDRTTPRPRRFADLAEYSPDADVGPRWARVTGDWQPIHLDDAAAQSVGFPRRVVHGRHSVAMAGALLTEHLAQGDAGRLRRLSIRFAKPIYPGDRVRVAISDVVEGADGPCRAWRAVASGRTALRDGWVTFAAPPGRGRPR